MKIRTVNVIEMSEFEVIGVTSFTDGKEGNKQAEEHFEKLIKKFEKTPVAETKSDKQDMEDAISIGEYKDGDYVITITHSS